MIETHSNDYTNAELTDFCNKIYKCHFSGKSMIFQAFTHSSYANDHRIGDNERLEFLGDSVLGFTVATYLYKTYPLKNEGTYSKIKSNVVSTESLAEITEKLGLHNYLKYNSNSIKCGNPKKLHANLFEACLGVLYLEKGFAKAESFVLSVLKTKIDKMMETDAITDYKSALQELTQKRKQNLEFTLQSRSGPDHSPIFKYAVVIDGAVYGEGVGINKAEAQAAASKASYGKYKRSK